MYHQFSVVETIKTSWNILKKNFITIIVYSVIAFILLAILEGVVEYIIAPEEFVSKMIFWSLLIFVQAYTTLGLYKLFFTLIDSEYYEFEFKQVLPHIWMILSYIAVVFILAFVFVNVSILFSKLDNHPDLQFIAETIGVIIGLYIVLRIMFFNTFIVDDRSGPIESLKQSFQLTQGYVLKIVLILLIILLLIAVPAFLSIYNPLISLAIIFTYPFVNIILAVTYRKLIYSHQDVDDDIAETN
jgi:hypothetical protein